MINISEDEKEWSTRAKAARRNEQKKKNSPPLIFLLPHRLALFVIPAVISNVEAHSNDLTLKMSRKVPVLGFACFTDRVRFPLVSLSSNNFQRKKRINNKEKKIDQRRLPMIRNSVSDATHCRPSILSHCNLINFAFAISSFVNGTRFLNLK